MSTPNNHSAADGVFVGTTVGMPKGNATKNKRIMRNGRLVTTERALELATISDEVLLKRMQIAWDMCDALEKVEREFGWKWRAHERSHWPLRAADYEAEAVSRGLL